MKSPFCLNNFALLEKYLGIQIIIADDSTEKYKKENQNIINTLKEKNEKFHGLGKYLQEKYLRYYKP